MNRIIVFIGGLINGGAPLIRNITRYSSYRDLAARNCLVGDEDAVKIADFGMSREDEGGIYIVQSGTRNIPIKWTAPEVYMYIYYWQV